MLMVCLISFLSAQDVTRREVTAEDLEVITIGHGHLRDGTVTLFRAYAGSGGAQGRVLYTEPKSLESAELLVEGWVKATQTVTSRLHDQKLAERLVSDRTLGTNKLPKSGDIEFVIIRRDYLKCYLIESTSLEVALTIEGFIGSNDSAKTKN